MPCFSESVFVLQTNLNIKFFAVLEIWKHIEVEVDMSNYNDLIVHFKSDHLYALWREQKLLTFLKQIRITLN